MKINDEGVVIFNSNLGLRAFILMRGRDGVHYLRWETLDELSRRVGQPDLAARVQNAIN